MPDVEANVLVVDDNEDSRVLLGRRLERRGYTVSMAEDGEKALELLAKDRYHLVLLDVMMPGLSGLDVLTEIRKTSTEQTLPVIMTTALSEMDDVTKALDLGANDYAVKPLEMPILLEKVRRLVAGEGEEDSAAYDFGEFE